MSLFKKTAPSELETQIAELEARAQQLTGRQAELDAEIKTARATAHKLLVDGGDVQKSADPLDNIGKRIAQLAAVSEAAREINARLSEARQRREAICRQAARDRHANKLDAVRDDLEHGLAEFETAATDLQGVVRRMQYDDARVYAHLIETTKTHVASGGVVIVNQFINQIARLRRGELDVAAPIAEPSARVEEVR